MYYIIVGLPNRKHNKMYAFGTQYLADADCFQHFKFFSIKYLKKQSQSFKIQNVVLLMKFGRQKYTTIVNIPCMARVWLL